MMADNLSLLLRLMLLFTVAAHSVLGQCRANQRALLLRLQTSLSFPLASSTKLTTWSQNNHRDCCLWLGVTCDSNGHVTSLDLTGESIQGRGFNDSSPLFHLHHLQSLDLSRNSFNGSQIPAKIGTLTNLVHLNLSNSGFGGQIPSQVSNLTRLTALDLSKNYNILKLDSPSLSTLVRNLTQLQELYLDRVNVYDTGKAWCQALSSSLPRLRVLSMSDSLLTGSLDASLLNLKHLEIIRLDNNFLTGSIDFLGELRSLTSLNLCRCEFSGRLPGNIFQLLMLETLDLSHNIGLQGFLTEFPKNASLESLDLSYTKLSGRLPESIGNLERLSSINLTGCNFDGEIPRSIEKLQNLVEVDLSVNKFNGTIPSFAASKRLNRLILSNNAFTGHLPDNWDTFQNLLLFNVNDNTLIGRIPPSLFSSPSLETLYLYNNRFSGELKIPSSNQNFSNLRYLNLSHNHLNGSLPKSLTRLYGLHHLSLASNNMTGYMDIGWFNVLTNLTSLDLSYNNFSIPKTGNLYLSQLRELKLTSCGLTSFPDMRELSTLGVLDLSDNQITGQVPNWIWDIGTNYSHLNLNLSHNQLTDLEEDYVVPPLDVLDIHSNMFRGHILFLPSAAHYIDYSYNHFTGPIPSGIGNLRQLESLDLSSNNLTGEIPKELTYLSFLSYLNLSNNQLVGEIPIGGQLQLFTAASYEGNKELHGAPLENMCGTCESPSPIEQHINSDEDNSIWIFLSVVIGFICGFWIFIGPLVLYERWRVWYNIHVDQHLLRLFPRLEQRNRGRQA